MVSKGYSGFHGAVNICNSWCFYDHRTFGCLWIPKSQWHMDKAGSAELSEFLTESERGWGWKAPLEVPLPNPLAQEGAPQARCPGAFPDGFWASLGPCRIVFRMYRHRQYIDSQFFFFFSTAIYNFIMTIKLHWWKQLRTYKFFFEQFLIFRNYIT